MILQVLLFPRLISPIVLYFQYYPLYRWLFKDSIYGSITPRLIIDIDDIVNVRAVGVCQRHLGSEVAMPSIRLECGTMWRLCIGSPASKNRALHSRVTRSRFIVLLTAVATTQRPNVDRCQPPTDKVGQSTSDDGGRATRIAQHGTRIVIAEINYKWTGIFF